MKGQTDIISVVIIFVISLGLVSTAYLWGIPLIEKRQDTALVDRVGNSFDKFNDNSLERKIEYIANNGGTYTFVADTNGIWYFNSSENSLSFSFTAKASKIATNTTPNPIPIGWVALSSGNTFVNGTLGIDDSFIVYARSDMANSGLYNITYKVQFRTLWDSTQTNGFKIVLNNQGASPYVLGKYAQITRGTVAPDPSYGNLINTQIQILLG